MFAILYHEFNAVILSCKAINLKKGLFLSINVITPESEFAANRVLDLIEGLLMCWVPFESVFLFQKLIIKSMEYFNVLKLG